MRILLWIIRALAIIVLLRIVLRMIFGNRFSAARTRGPQAGRKPQERIGGELIRCARCGTYVPRDRALVQGTGDRAVYFCSETCANAGATA